MRPTGARRTPNLLHAPPFMTRRWLMKAEPSEESVDDFLAAPSQTLPWTGVRSFQARNFIREMSLGDDVLFYHSSCPEPGIVGLAKIAGAATPDETQFDPASHYHDAKATREKPYWSQIDVRVVRKTRPLGLPEMRAAPSLSTMTVLKRGNRLSITPVNDDEWRAVLALLEAKPAA